MPPTNDKKESNILVGTLSFSVGYLNLVTKNP